MYYFQVYVQFIRYTHLVPGRTPICLQNSLNSSGMDSTSQKRSTGMLVHADAMASRSCCRLDVGPPPPACTVDTRQDGSMDSWCLCQILTLPSAWRNRNWDSSDQAIFFTLLNCRSGALCGHLLQ